MVFMMPSLKEAKKRTRNAVNNYRYIKDSIYSSIGKNKKYYIKTYGCQMNEHDSENIKALLEEMGFSETFDMENADLILLNTCAIRENAHNKVFGFLGRVKHLKETKKDIITGICGCMAQEENVVNEIKNKHKWVDIVFGTHNISNLPEILKNSIENHRQNICVLSVEGDIVEDIPVKRNSKYKAFVNIMYGCDKFCTYCIVPYTRGKQRSRNPRDIIKEVENLVHDGYKEVTLLGQNVNAYGKDLNLNYYLGDLLKDVALTSIPRVRFLTSHPWDFTDEMIDVIKKYDNIMPYIHLPLQSGSDRILKLMGRRYTKDSYLQLYKKIKGIPNVAITTDIIVGFPNETEDDFNETLSVVDICKYDSAFTFIFSPREGTPAALMEDNVGFDVKSSRLHKLNEKINYYANLNNQKYLNKVVKVLIEGNSNKEGYLMGYTDTMKLVNVKNVRNCIGEIVNVKITDVKTWSMTGKMID